MKAEKIRWPEALGDGKPPSMWLLAWIGAGVIAFLVGIVYFQDKLQPPSIIPGPLTSAERLDIIAGKWDAEPRVVTGECPTVRALELAAPHLRGVDARERDYVAFLRGERCQ